MLESGRVIVYGDSWGFLRWEILLCEICIFFSRLLIVLEGRGGVQAYYDWIPWELGEMDFDDRKVECQFVLTLFVALSFTWEILFPAANFSLDILSKCMSSYGFLYQL